MERCMEQGMADRKELYLALPHIVRGETPQGYFEQAERWIGQGMKGFLVRNLEAFARLESLGYADRCVLDSSVYTWNREAIAYFREKGVLRNTAPLELNEKELRHRDNRGSELLVYGYLPLMVSAQCVRKNLFGCDRSEGTAQLRDRYDAVFESVCHCNPWKMKNTKEPRYCYNMIYNSLPYALIKDQEIVESLGFDAFRLSFTTEDAQKTDAVIQAFLDVWISGRDFPKWEFTRGHFKRGVE
jgi:putative protease